jgi:uncharacterized protein DUF4389
MSAYYAAPGGVPPTAAEQQTPAPVLVAFAGPLPQSRLTVLVRILMVIPHFIVLALLGIAVYVITVIGWFGALFTGRLPVFAADFLTGYLRWQTRVFAYTILLTDVYPPFSLDDADYPVRIAALPGRLNRLAVLFRFFLLIPCWIVTTIVGYGAFTIVQFVSWLIVLTAGGRGMRCGGRRAGRCRGGSFSLGAPGGSWLSLSCLARCSPLAMAPLRGRPWAAMSAPLARRTWYRRTSSR